MIRSLNPLNILTWITKAIDFIYRNCSFYQRTKIGHVKACGIRVKEKRSPLSLQIEFEFAKSRSDTCLYRYIKVPLFSVHSIILYKHRTRLTLKPML